ncbi:MAG: DUF1847 domain-containing protein, partial [Gemmatimonadota bacterium]
VLAGHVPRRLQHRLRRVHRQLPDPDQRTRSSPQARSAREDERMLCRLAELVYFAMEMGYAKLGVAFCADLLEPATVLVGVLRRFFDVLPVCCKVGAAPAEESRSTPCNPAGQAAVMNQAGTDLNVLVGLCVGADAVFARESRAPVTTIFVKDKSLANNPIGAVYSHYHLQEI